MSSTHQNLLRLFNVRRGEEQLVLLLATLGFLEGLANVLARTTTYSLFVDEFGAQNLPFAYIGIALFASLFSYIYLRATQRYALGRVLLGVEIFVVLLLLVLRIGLEFVAGSWLAFSMPVAFGVLNALQITAYWAMVGRILDLQQNKRLSGLLDSGAVVAFILGGFVTPLLVRWMGATNILFFAAFLVTVAFFVLLRIVRMFSARVGTQPEEAAETKRRSKQHPIRNRYVGLIVLNFTLFVVGIYFVDNIFFGYAELRFPDPDALTSFVGLFWGFASVLILFTQVFFAGRVLTRFGVGIVMLITPLSLTFEGGIMAVAGTIFGVSVFLFWMAVLANLTRIILDGSDQAATNVLFQALPEQLRTEVQSMVTGIVYPIAIGLAGVGLLLSTRVLRLDVVQLTYVLVVITLAWAGVALLLKREYPKALIRALTRRDFGNTEYLVTDPGSLAILTRSLSSPNVGVVQYSLNLLEQVQPEAIPEHLPALLNHPSSIVRLDALERVERLELTSALPAVSARFELEEVPAVQGAILRTSAVLCDSDDYDDIFPYLECANAELRRGALVGLLRSGSLEGMLTAGGKLMKEIDSSDAEERRFAAQVLGESGLTAYYRSVLKLLDDAEPAVQRTALVAAAKLNHPELWPTVIDCLDSKSVRSAAMSALIAGGPHLLPEIRAGFDRYTGNSAVEMRLARVLGRMCGPEVVELLEQRLDQSDEQTRSQILLALGKCRHHADGKSAERFNRWIEAEVAQAAWLAAALIDLQNENATALLSASLRQHLQRIRQRVMQMLACLHDVRALREVSAALGVVTLPTAGSTAAQQRAYALETLDVLLTSRQRRLISPLVDGSSAPELVKTLHSEFPQEELPASLRVKSIIEGSPVWFTPWARALAIAAVAQLPAPQLTETVQACRESTDPVICETAIWALSRLTITSQSSLQDKGETAMLTIVEKVIALKGMPFFTDTPDEVLVDVADFLEERAVKAGETIFEKGDLGDTLYIIVEGAVRIHSGGETITELGEHDAFGDYAILDPAPRSASATATEDSRLLLLDRDTFEELIEDHSSVARTIMRDLVRSIRGLESKLRPEVELPA